MLARRATVLGLGVLIACWLAMLPSNAPAASVATFAMPKADVTPGPSPSILMVGDVDEPATQLRVTLGQLLAEHAFLVLEAIRGSTLGSPDAVAAKAALDTNSSDLAAAIGSVYGSAAAAAFDPLWRRHIDLILDYARAKAAGDTATMNADRAALDAYRQTFAKFLARANPKIDASAEAEALRLHIEQLIAYTDANFDRAYAAQSAAFEHMFMFGDDLALAIARQFPSRFRGANVAFAPAAELRITLDRLLAEHLILTAEAMRAVLASAPDADAAARAISDNTEALRVAVTSVYGDAAGASFVVAWKQHIDLYLALIREVATHDAAGRDATVAKLDGAEGAIVDFFAGAIPGLPRDALTEMVREHVRGLVSQLDAYAARDYSGAFLGVHDSYRHMFDIGKALASGISGQFPDRFATLTSIPATDTEPARRAGPRPSPPPSNRFARSACLIR